MSETEKLAEEHWQFLEKWLHLVFVDGFIHGYKHAKKEVQPKKIDVVQTMDRQEHEEFMDEYYPREEAKP